MPAQPAPLIPNPALRGVRNARREQRDEPQIDRRAQEQATALRDAGNVLRSTQPTLSTQTESQFKIFSNPDQRTNPALAPTQSIRSAKRITALTASPQPINNTFSAQYTNPDRTSANKKLQRVVADRNLENRQDLNRRGFQPKVTKRRIEIQRVAVSSVEKKLVLLGLQGLAATFYATIQLPLALTGLTFLGISGGLTSVINDFFSLLNTITLGTAELLVNSISSLFGDEISLSYIMIPAFVFMFIGGLLALLVTIFIILTLFLSGISPFSGKGAIGKLASFILSLFIFFPVFNLVPWISIYLLVVRFTYNSSVD